MASVAEPRVHRSVSEGSQKSAFPLSNIGCLLCHCEAFSRTKTPFRGTGRDEMRAMRGHYDLWVFDSCSELVAQ